ncbi:hypothetical protein [Symbiopectobacterium sp.]
MDRQKCSGIRNSYLGEAIKIMHDRLLPQQSALAGAMPSASFPYAKVV